MKNLKIKKLGCIGAGYVGGSTMAVFAKYCPDIKIYVYDINVQRIKEWESQELPIYEPGLDELVFEARGKNLFFTTSFDDLIDCEMIFMSVNTPTKRTGMGAGRAANLQYIELCSREIAKKIRKGNHIIVEKSTVPVKTADCVRTILEQDKSPDVNFEILSNPEFMAEGTAVRDLIQPHRVIIGGQSLDAVNVLSSLYEKWIPPERIIKTNVWSSELSKLISNALLAQRISSINAVSALCEKTGANVQEVSRAVGMDARIGKYFLNASIGFGGSCFQKDILNLVYLCEMFGLPEAANYFKQIIMINDWQRARFVEIIVRNLFQTVTNKNLAVFGFAFKKNTGDTRESSAIYIAKRLLNERANLRIYDPKVKEGQIFKDLQEIMDGSYYEDPLKVVNTEMTNDVVKKHVKVFKDPYKCVEGCHAIVVITEWDEFKEYDYEKMYNMMMKPAWVFDGRVILDRSSLRRIGFKVYQVGKSLEDEAMMSLIVLDFLTKVLIQHLCPRKFSLNETQTSLQILNISILLLYNIPKNCTLLPPFFVLLHSPSTYDFLFS